MELSLSLAVWWTVSLITMPPRQVSFFFVIRGSFRLFVMPGSLNNRKDEARDGKNRRGEAHQLRQGVEPCLSYRNERQVRSDGRKGLKETGEIKAMGN